jgi:CheY-like chemotaxis protein
MKHKILVIDDEPTLVTAIVDKFTREDFEVLTATNGKEGLKTALEQHPDLILLDIIMPVMDGITMLSELRKDQWGKKVKIILLTNLFDAGNMEKTLYKSVSGYFIKSEWKLIDMVKQVKHKLKLTL